jgi:hypothetical protein
MKPYINIRLYPQTQTVATNIDIYNRQNELVQSTDTRYMVEHIYEIILPYVEQYARTHDIIVRMNGKQLDIGEIETSYFACMNE